MDRRTEQMNRVASQMDTIVKENGRRKDIAITYPWCSHQYPNQHHHG